MAAKVTPISLQEDVREYGQRIAKEMFGNNLSAFISFLICNHRAGNQFITGFNKIEEPKKQEQKRLNGFLSSIDNHFNKS